MDVSNVTPAAVAASRSAQTQEAFAMKVMAKTLDISAEQGQMLAQMIGQGAGLGNHIDTMA